MLLGFAKIILFTALLTPAVGPEVSLLAAFCIAIVTLRPQLRWNVISFASPIYWVLFYFFWTRPGSKLYLEGLSIGEALAFKVTIVALVYFVAAISIFSVRKFRGAALVPILAYLLSIFCTTISKGFPLALAMSEALSQGLLAFMWPLTAISFAPDLLTTFSKKRLVATIAPLWQFNPYQPTPIHIGVLQEFEVASTEEFKSAQTSGFILIAWLTALSFLTKALDLWMLNIPFTYRREIVHFFPQPLPGEFDLFLNAHPEWPVAVAYITAILYSMLRLLLHFAISYGIGVSVARMLGFNLPKMVDRPFAALSFGDFLSRILHYYNQLLMKVFFPLFRRFVPKFFPVKVRLWIAVFLTVFLGGFIYHAMRDARFVNDSDSFSLGYLNVLPYYFILALACAFSGLNRVRDSGARRGWLSIKPAFYFTGYAMIYSLNLLTIHCQKSWSQIGEIALRILLLR